MQGVGAGQRWGGSTYLVINQVHPTPGPTCIKTPAPKRQAESGESAIPSVGDGSDIHVSPTASTQAPQDGAPTRHGGGAGGAGAAGAGLLLVGRVQPLLRCVVPAAAGAVLRQELHAPGTLPLGQRAPALHAHRRAQVQLRAAGVQGRARAQPARRGVREPSRRPAGCWGVGGAGSKGEGEAESPHPETGREGCRLKQLDNTLQRGRENQRGSLTERETGPGSWRDKGTHTVSDGVGSTFRL